MVLTFEANKIRGRDLDPTCRMARERTLQLRRTMERRPDAKARAQCIVEPYCNSDEAWNNPAPHPNVASRIEYMHKIKPMGPIGYLMQSINLMGGHLNCDWTITMPDEAPLDIQHAPFQCLAKAVLNRATNARMKASAKKTMKSQTHEVRVHFR